MSRSSGYSELAGALATVAIASLGGPLAAGGAALAELVKHMQARYDAGASTRDLRKQVTMQITQWAESERFAPQEIELGLALATETMAQFGLNVAEIATLQFDPLKVSRQAQQAAQARNPSWGTEEHYEVAERGIEATYRILIRQFKASEPLLLPAIQAVRSSIDDNAARIEAIGRNTQATLDNLAAALIAAGTTADVMFYLASRIADWDVSVWHSNQQAQSAIERRLWVRTTGPPAGGQEMSSEEALTGQRMLVVQAGVTGSSPVGSTNVSALSKRYCEQSQ